jgi:hypothetical protein
MIVIVAQRAAARLCLAWKDRWVSLVYCVQGIIVCTVIGLQGCSVVLCILVVLC